MDKQKKRILVVDDLPTDSGLLKRYFEECHEYDVKEVNDPTAAVVTGESFEPDLIILDLLMPVMDGLEVAGAINASQKLKSVPIVFITAAITREQVAAAGGKIRNIPFLAKPIHLGEVAAIVRQQFDEQLTKASVEVTR
jgi:CheY-like chemotaxis protein